MSRSLALRTNAVLLTIGTLLAWSGVILAVTSSETLTNSRFWGVICMTILPVTMWLQFRRGARDPKAGPWRDDGRRVLWWITTGCLLLGAAFWLASLLG